MPDPVEAYLDAVMAHARLAPVHQKRVRAELREHLLQLVSLYDRPTPTEVSTMLEKEFGNPADIGKGIGRSGGWFKNDFKRAGRGTAVSLAVALLLAVSVRWAVAEEYYITSDSVAPAVPRGSRCLVYKLSSAFQPGDVIVYRAGDGGNHYVAIVKQMPNAETLMVERHGDRAERVSRSQVIGRVILNTR